MPLGQEVMTATDGILSVAVTPDSKTLISTSVDKSLRLWDLTTGKELPRPPGQQQAFTALANPVYLAMAPDNKKLLAWMPGKDWQFYVGAVAGLNRDAPDAEFYFGVSRRF